MTTQEITDRLNTLREVRGKIDLEIRTLEIKRYGSARQDEVDAMSDDELALYNRLIHSANENCRINNVPIEPSPLMKRRTDP